MSIKSMIKKVDYVFCEKDFLWCEITTKDDKKIQGLIYFIGNCPDCAKYNSYKSALKLMAKEQHLVNNNREAIDKKETE